MSNSTQSSAPGSNNQITPMETCFAPAEKASDEALQRALSFLTANPVIDSVMQAISSLVIVMNEQRQIICANNAMLAHLGIDNIDSILGARLGNALQCIHAQEAPHGCGTTQFCSTCGAAISMVTSLELNKPVEKICAVTLNVQGVPADYSFQVRSAPIHFEGNRYLLVCLNDVTLQQTRALAEQAFFHDLANIMPGLLWSSRCLAEQPGMEDVRDAKKVHRLVQRIAREIEIQRILSGSMGETYHLTFRKMPIGEVIKEAKDFFADYPAAEEKSLVVGEINPAWEITTDRTLLMRVLTNMLKNAFEATDPGGLVKLSASQEGDLLSFSVWSQKALPPEVQLRIFQKHFSTKPGSGRGIGTFSMKLLGEKLLKGKVSFTSSAEDGTVFSLVIPHRFERV